MRLIDADAMIADSREDPIGRQLIAKYNLDGYIYGRPTVDAVPVIRCRECKYYEVNGIGYHWGYCARSVRNVDESDYCSLAERKEENGK